MPVDDEARAEIGADLTTLQAQLHSPKPKRVAVKAALAGIGMVLGSLTLNVAGNATWEAGRALVHRL